MVARSPRKRMYRTMQGRMVDIEKLRAANESVQAVGNMNVNARGDVLGPRGSVVSPKAEVIQKYYEQPRGKVDDAPSKSKSATPPVKAPVQTAQYVRETLRSANCDTNDLCASGERATNMIPDVSLSSRCTMPPRGSASSSGA